MSDRIQCGTMYRCQNSKDDIEDKEAVKISATAGRYCESKQGNCDNKYRTPPFKENLITWKATSLHNLEAKTTCALITFSADNFHFNERANVSSEASGACYLKSLFKSYQISCKKTLFFLLILT